ncbi:MAG: RrF2 family transcriptional regulator [Armatimonadota bacterium]
MKLSTRATYGMRAMLALALDDGQSPLMVREMAEKQNLPATYLEQLMAMLRKAGLVNATRGAHGGYTLARSAREITMAEIVEVLEGSLDLIDCTTVASCCCQPSSCALKDFLTEASQALAGVFQGTTLADLADRQRAKEHAYVDMYAI